MCTSYQSEWPSSRNLQTINAAEGVEKREPSCTTGGNVNWYSHYREQQKGSLKKKKKILKIELKHDPSIPLLGIHPQKTIIIRHTRNPIFITVLFTIARACKQPKCYSTDEWMNKLWYIYTVEYYSAIIRNKIGLFVIMFKLPSIHSIPTLDSHLRIIGNGCTHNS